jgi:membrane-bound lytic murein transglycosylase B
MNKFLPLLAVSAVLLSSCQTTTGKKTPIAPIPAAAAVPVPAPEPGPAPDTAELSVRKEQFIRDTAKKHALPEAYVRDTLAKAQYKQGIVNAMSKPAESTKTWAQYRPIFLTEGRIAQGRKYLSENRAEVDRVAGQYGVPSEIILAIMGVETGWGQNMGSHNVLDALYTLAFYYPVINGKPNPARSAFFTDELSQLFALAKEEGFDILSLKGSYAGAMGLGQFMPSSYRNFAKDGDGDGKRDLFNSRQDAFASIANYFVGHGWQPGRPAFVRATAAPGAAPFKPENWEAKYSLAELKAKGFSPSQPVADLPATLLTLEGAQGTEHWIGFKNFWVITRYNRSPMYAMSVYQLSQEIAQRSYDIPSVVTPEPAAAAQ